MDINGLADRYLFISDTLDGAPFRSKLNLHVNSLLLLLFLHSPDMQQAGNDEQLYPGLLDLSSLPSVLVRREIDLCKMAENRAEAKQQQIQSGKRQSSKQSVQVRGCCDKFLLNLLDHYCVNIFELF